MRFTMPGTRVITRIGALLCIASVFVTLPDVSGVHGASAAQQPVFPKRQLRAAWIATVTNIDWPSKTGLSIAAQKQEFIGLLETLQKMNFNAVVVQIKPTADAFYPSQYGPWSEYLTGVQGKDPGYNPLAFMLEEAHKRNFEFHAWFNPYRISMQDDMNRLAPDHPARKHKDWVIAYGGKLYYNPGEPAARDFIEQSVLEVVKNYDIDAVHMDDYFYPYPVDGQDFPDDATYKKYGAGKFANKADWRRDNVNRLVQELSQKIKHEKQYVKFGISPFGVWRNKSDDPTGSDTRAGTTNYDTLYADTRLWIKQGWLDYITPQIYWNIGFEVADYAKLVDWWNKEVQGSRTQLYTGQAAYKIGTDSPPDWKDPEEIPDQLRLNLRYKNVQGSMFFSMKDLQENRLKIRDKLAQELYKYPALIPTMPWIDKLPPTPVELVSARATEQGVELHWMDLSCNDATSFAIYRFEGNEKPGAADFANASNLLTLVRNQQGDISRTFVDKTAQHGKTYTYFVTALDRLHNESDPGKGRTVKLP
uniref:Glycosyl hydrolase-like 10 domain-containing protein n=1 Tax=Thermosporothrix sp. COM3 TaxID=2490863 RepID=A0A455SPP3_9CHLR|nr:hypothetical protein KTC_41290 [Thermosporothrix sp. COM3]